MRGEIGMPERVKVVGIGIYYGPITKMDPFLFPEK